MSRISAVVFSLITLHLIACCCCGPVPNNPGPQAAAPKAPFARFLSEFDTNGKDEQIQTAIAAAKTEPPETPHEFIARFGQPDKDDDGLSENPRPLMPGRVLTYRKAKVQVFYLPTNKEFPVRLPIQGYKLLQYQDWPSQEIIAAIEVSQRFNVLSALRVK